MHDQPPTKVAATAMSYSQQDVRDQIDQLARNNARMARLLRFSCILWRRDSPDDLVQEAFRRILKASPGTISAVIPFHRSVAFFMTRQAVDWGRKQEPGNLITGIEPQALEAATAPVSGRKPARSSSDDVKTERTGFGALAALNVSRPPPSPEDDCHAHQILTVLFERIGDDTQLSDYMIARYVDDLKGEDLRKTMDLTKAQFVALTRRANRMLSTIKDEISR